MVGKLKVLELLEGMIVMDLFVMHDMIVVLEERVVSIVEKIVVHIDIEDNVVVDKSVMACFQKHFITNPFPGLILGLLRKFLLPRNWSIILLRILTF